MENSSWRIESVASKRDLGTHEEVESAHAVR